MISIGMFAIPVALSLIFQRMFSVIDTMVAGKFIDADALAAVGSTSTVTFVILGMGTGFAIASNMLVAKTYGEKNHKKLEEMIQLSVWAAVVIGMISGVIGIVFSRQLLLWVGVQIGYFVLIPMKRLCDTIMVRIWQSCLFIQDASFRNVYRGAHGNTVRVVIFAGESYIILLL